MAEAAAPDDTRRSFVVAVDGPAASGKGTLARRLAQHFNLRYLDTGLLYRAVGAECLSQGTALDDEPAVAAVARALDLQIAPDPAAAAALRSDAAAQAASRVSALPAVRAALLQAQRDFAAAEKGGAVLDGRDIGTAVCPGAAAKLFVTASAEVRARRRFLELSARARRRGGLAESGEVGGGGEEKEEKGRKQDDDDDEGDGEAAAFERVLADLVERDARDEGRAASPLRRADDAMLLDTSGMDADAAFEVARLYVEERRRRWMGGEG
jgi:CMP/dCMP kinase